MKKHKIYRDNTYRIKGLRKVSIVRCNFSGDINSWIDRYDFYDDGKLVDSIEHSVDAEQKINNFIDGE